MVDDTLALLGPLVGPVASQLLPLGIGVALLLFATLHDVATRTIPNWTSIGLALLGLLLRFADHQLVAGISLAAAVFVVSAFCWQRGWMGGGDVKLLSAAAIFVPPGQVGNMLMAITLAGGAIGLLYVAIRFAVRRHADAAGRPRPRRLLARIARAERRRLLRGTSLPYASAIAVGTLFVIVAG